MLLVLRRVAGHRLVAELAELDPNLLGGHLVRAVADDRPVPLGRSEAARGVGDHVTAVEGGAHRVGQRPQRCEELGPTAGVAEAGRLGDRTRQQCTGRHLGVERLGRRHAHLDVTTVGGVHHPVGLVGEIRTPSIDDADHVATTGPDQVDGAVRVGRGPRLTDRDGQRVAHVETEVETGQFGGRDRIDVERRSRATRRGSRRCSGRRPRRFPGRSPGTG